MMPSTPAEVESIARALRTALEPHISLSHDGSLDAVARMLGLRDANALAAELVKPALGSPMPILRVTDAARARRFSVEWLGFTVDFEHRFFPSAPLFLGVSRGGTALGLSEHRGDGTPGSVVWIPTSRLAALRDSVMASAPAGVHLGSDADAPGGPTLTIVDPFGNQLRFCEPSDDSSRAE